MSNRINTVCVAEPMNVSNGTLTISNVGFDDSRVYYCRAVNSVFHVTRRVSIITVVDKLVNDIKQF